MKSDSNRQSVSVHLRSQHLWVLVAVCGLPLLLELFGDAGRELLRYDRTGIAAGELWRPITGHWVHLGWKHMALNLAGLILMALLFFRNYSPGRWLAIVFVSSVAIDLGLYFFEPQLQWYVGLSGVLHGVMAAGILAHWRTREPDAWVLTIFLIGKLVWEQWAGPLPSSEIAAGGAVIVQAHLYGALGGAVAALGLRYC